MDALNLARIQFAANISFHILFPTISIALTWVLLYFKWRHARSADPRWFEWPRMALPMPIPLATAMLFVRARLALRTLPRPGDQGRWIPVACAVGIFMLAFAGLAYSAYPYLVMDRITIRDAASAPESLRVILYGALVTLPAIVIYTVISYRVFRGKATELRYY